MKLDKLVKKITTMKIIISMQIIATLIFLFFLLKLNILPMRHLISVITILVLVIGGFIIIYSSGIKKYGKDNKRKRNNIIKVCSILLSIFLMISTSYVIRSDSFIDNLKTDKDESRYVVSVIVMKDSKVKKLKDLNGKDFGVCYKDETETLTEAVAHFEEKIGTQKYTKVDDYAQLADKLYDGKVDVIIAGVESLSLLEANHENFEDETRVIETYEITKVNKSTTVHTNVTQEPFVIYLTGIDTRGPLSTRARSDVNLIVTVNPKTKQILMVSIPRDTEIILHSKQKMDKLTHAGNIGPKETVNTIQDFLDVKINYYARTNFSGIEDIVDALGGVTIDSPHEDFTTLHGNYTIHKGINEMDGDKALCFVRERKDLPNGDFDRGRNQQLLLKALLDKAMSPKFIINFSNVLSAIEGTFETDMSGDEMKSLLNMQISDMSSWQMFNVQVSGKTYQTTKTYSTKSKVDVVKPNEADIKRIKDLIDNVQAGKKLTNEDIKGLE